MSTKLFEVAPPDFSDVTSTLHTYEAFKCHWIAWQICGIKCPKNPKWKVPYIVYAIVLNITVTLVFPISLLVNLFLSQNFSQLCENIYTTITEICVIFKFLNLFIVRSKLFGVTTILARLDSRAIADGELQALRIGMRSVRKCFYIFAILYGCVPVTSQLVVYFAKERILMYQAWFPLDWKNSNRDFLIVHSYEVYVLTVIVIQNLGNDTYPQAYLRILCAHIEALSLRILKLGNNNMLDSKEINRELIECIKDHQDIIQLFKTIQQIISTPSFAQFICTGLAQCTIGVYMLCVGFDVSKILNSVIFLACITSEILILCFFGDQLYQSSEILTTAIYSCNWMDQDKEFKTSILMLLKRSQTPPLVIMAGGIIPLRLTTFVQVMKTAYSTFTVLCKVN